MNAPNPLASKYRNLRPSNATMIGAGGAAAVAPLIVAGLTAAHVAVTPELAAAVSPALAFLFSWFPRGGRQGEPQ